MLWSLHIENIAVIEKADITFDAGFNVLTGETGAGKSIVIDSINAVLGERVSRDLVRAGSGQAAVSAVFSDLSAAAEDKLRELGFETDEDGMLLIQRTISAEGKGGCRINGRPATVSMLRECGRLLVNIHGQHENQALLAPEKHVEYLDRLGGLLPLRAEYRSAYDGWQHLRRQLDAVQMDEDQKLRRLDLLRYQVDEIEAAELVPGESAQLQERRTFFRNVEKIAQGLYAARALLQGDEDADGVLTGVERRCPRCRRGRYMDEAAKLGERDGNLQYDLEACAEEVRALTEQLEFDPQELEQGRRGWMIRRLTAKYGPEEEDVLAFAKTPGRSLNRSRRPTAARLRMQLEKRGSGRRRRSG
ncbi:MAG: AAA family ATPase [Acutalibacteraceae bacterium]